MSIISKDLARQISVKLTEKSRIASDKLHVEYRELVTSFYEDQTPKEIKDVLKKFPEWLYTRSTARLEGHGFNWEHVSTTRQIVCNNGNDCILKLTAKIADQVLKSKRKWEKAKEQHQKLMDESNQALLTLKTFNNIRKELPEAAPMLPPPISNALVVNFSSLKHRLKNQPDSKLVELINS